MATVPNQSRNDKLPKRRIVIVGIGNILLSDEGIGVHVINELKNVQLPENVEIHDCGTGGLSILNVLDKAEKAVIIDAVRGGSSPGSIYRFMLDEILTEDRRLRMTSLHDLDLTTALKIAELTHLYQLPTEMVVIGVEPASIEMGMELSPQIRRTMPKIIDLVLKEIKRD